MKKFIVDFEYSTDEDKVLNLRELLKLVEFGEHQFISLIFYVVNDLLTFKVLCRCWLLTSLLALYYFSKIVDPISRVWRISN